MENSSSRRIDSNLTFRENYWDDSNLKKEFIKFLIKIHRLDLSLWDKTGFWDNDFRPFSYFDGQKLVAGLCIYSMDMMVSGKRRRVAQISSVGTLEEYRRKGLNYQLTQKALEWARENHDFFFLFADLDAYPFYEKCGFRRVLEHKERIAVEGKACRPGSEKLDVQNNADLELIYRMASEREPVSEMLGVYNPKLLKFWCLYYLKDNIYYVADLDLLVLYERSEGLVTIFDVVGKNIPPFEEIYPYVSSENDKTVEFMFMADRMNIGSAGKLVPIAGNGTHLMGDFPLEGREFIFPFTAHA